MFRAGGKGGQKQNKTSSGVRIIHRPSGAVGEARDNRQQIVNKKHALRRMAESKEFKSWVRLEAARRSGQTDLNLTPENVKVEYQQPDGSWEIAPFA